jgi:hypothetical protein
MPNKKLYDMLGINPAPKVATEDADILAAAAGPSLEEIIEDAEPAPKKGKKKK